MIRSSTGKEPQMPAALFYLLISDLPPKADMCGAIVNVRLGQKQTYAPQQDMSALALTATAKADIRA
jgi:hypothetical protein